MSRRVLLLSLFFSFSLFAGLNCENDSFTGSYVVLASRYLRPNSAYSVSVNLLEAKEPVVVRVRIMDGQNQSVVQKWHHSVLENAPTVISIDKVPANLTPDVQYKLFVQGETVSGRVLFQNSSNLQLLPKTLSIFVQTDRAVYKPNSEVHIRVIVVRADLKPYSGQANISVTDPNGNIIKQHLNVPVESGVCGKNDLLKLNLNKEPPLGDWQITVRVEDEKLTKEFSVDKYVLPTFEVEIVPPSVPTVDDDIQLHIRAKYTYGRGVEGNVSVIGEYPWPYYASEEAKVASKLVELDTFGEVKVTFTNQEMREAKLIRHLGYDQIKFTAVVMEKLTGQARNASTTVTVYKYPVKLVINRQKDHFKSGLNYTFTVSARLQNDQPILHEQAKRVHVNVDYAIKLPAGSNDTSSNETDVSTQTSVKRLKYSNVYQLDRSGDVEITIHTPSYCTSMRIEARYGSEDSSISANDYVDPLRSSSNNFLQLSSAEGSVQVDNIFTVDIRTSVAVNSVVALVLSKGSVVLQGTVQMKDVQGRLQFKAESEMSPRSKIIAYAVIPSTKEIVVDALDIEVEGNYNTGLNLTIDPTTAEPNANVTFSLSSAPYSFIGLLVVDQSALLLKGSNDIDADTVDNEMYSYSTPSYGPFVTDNIIERRRRFTYCRSCNGFEGGGRSAYSLLRSSGLIIFTDAFLYKASPGEEMFHLYNKAQMFNEHAVAFPMLGSAAGPGFTTQASREPVRIRSKFPETWLWKDLYANESGVTSLSVSVPDTITSWVATAFSVSEKWGLKILPQATKLQVFRPFFIRLNLPYSVKRGEQIGLQVLIFNYMDEPKIVNVQLNNWNSSDFDLVERVGGEEQKSTTNTVTRGNQRIVKVEAKRSSTVFFPIRPKRSGAISILITARTDGAADAVEMPLIVQPEGHTLYHSQSFIIDLRDKSSFHRSFLAKPLQPVVEGSKRVEFTLIGDIMGSALENIKQLIRMPYGCGEQNMINFVPNIIILHYLTAVGLLTPELKKKLISYTEAGYQQEMNYQRDDSSYSVFGKKDAQGSTWLTAFVVRSFAQAKPFIFIDEDRLNASLKYLQNQQKENGMFEESGTVLHKNLQGGSGEGGTPVTAYVYLALLENKLQNFEALNYLEHSLKHISKNSYSLAIVTYALHMANSSKKEEAFRLLETLSIEKDSLKYWSNEREASKSADHSSSLFYERSPPADIETTAYALLTYVLRNATSAAHPIVRWLVSKKDSLGGFSSTQDTVIALQALAAYAERTYNPTTSMQVTLQYNNSTRRTLEMNQQNRLVFQTVHIDNADQLIEVNASGRGNAFAQVNWQYNTVDLPTGRPFVCDLNVVQKAYGDVKLSICCRYNLPGRSNMAVLELQTLSGFVFDAQALSALLSQEQLERVETEKQDTQANFYFNSLNSDPLCFSVSSQLAYQVADQKPANVRLYDYYEPSNRIEFDYKIARPVLMEDMCGGDCYTELSPSALTASASARHLPRALLTMGLCVAIFQMR